MINIIKTNNCKINLIINNYINNNNANSNINEINSQDNFKIRIITTLLLNLNQEILSLIASMK